MDFWDIVSWAAWGVSASIFLWMVHAWRASNEYEEDVLLGSRDSEK